MVFLCVVPGLLRTWEDRGSKGGGAEDGGTQDTGNCKARQISNFWEILNFVPAKGIWFYSVGMPRGMWVWIFEGLGWYAAGHVGLRVANAYSTRDALHS